MRYLGDRAMVTHGVGPYLYVYPGVVDYCVPIAAWMGWTPDDTTGSTSVEQYRSPGPEREHAQGSPRRRVDRTGGRRLERCDQRRLWREQAAARGRP